MSEDLLYRRDLLRLAADTSHAGHLPAAAARASARNPACGDQIHIELALADGRITALAHDTQACALTQASAALLAELAPGCDKAGLAALADKVQAWLAGGPTPAPGYGAFAGATGLPGRHVCVMLPLRAALAAFSSADKPAP